MINDFQHQERLCRERLERLHDEASHFRRLKPLRQASGSRHWLSRLFARLSRRTPRPAAA